MILEIRNISSIDVDDLPSWRPVSVDDVFFYIEFEIAEKDSAGGNYFQVNIATPEGIRKYFEEYRIEFIDRKLLVFSEYDWDNCSRTT